MTTLCTALTSHSVICPLHLQNRKKNVWLKAIYTFYTSFIGSPQCDYYWSFVCTLLTSFCCEPDVYWNCLSTCLLTLTSLFFIYLLNHFSCTLGTVTLVVPPHFPNLAHQHRIVVNDSGWGVRVPQLTSLISSPSWPFCKMDL